MRVRRIIVSFMVGSHRALFTIATALLGVSGSLVADDPHTLSNYFLLFGTLFLMYVEDECGEIESASRPLGGPATPIDARNDLFDTRNSALLLTIGALSIALLAAGFVLVVT
jgi:hypothetical protein